MQIRKYTLFTTLHPLVLLLYTWGALVLAMLLNHPVYVLISFVFVLVCSCFYYGVKSTGKSLAMICPMAVLIAGINILTNHRGMTVLFRVGHTAYTAESLVYGMVNALMLGSVILWFKCYTAIVSNEKFLYLFGRKFPGTALLLSMILKLFPETKYKIRCIQNAQQDFRSQGKRKKAMRQISCLLEWSMEDSIETADSMKARGCGEGRRSSYENYRFSRGDFIWTVCYVFVFVLMGAGLVSGSLQFTYYPTFSFGNGGMVSERLSETIYAVFLLSPVLMEGWDILRQGVCGRRTDFQSKRGEE